MPWLMKAEPDSRLEKGIDVKAMGVSKWDGVRNHQAKNMMKNQMKIGDEVLFYHSNCKEPGVYGLAKVVKEGYPDYTSWDPSHPYHDPKSVSTSPTWYMVDVQYASHLNHPVLLSLFKYLAGCERLPDEVGYIGEEGLRAIKEMVLVRAGRLSVQPVTPAAYATVLLLGERGGWEDLIPAKKKNPRKPKVEEDQSDNVVAQDVGVDVRKKGRKPKSSEQLDEDGRTEQPAAGNSKGEKISRKRKGKGEINKAGSDLANTADGNETTKGSQRKSSKRKAVKPDGMDEAAPAKTSKRRRVAKGSVVVENARMEISPAKAEAEEESELSSLPDE